MPTVDFSYDWYSKAYSILRYSKGDNGYIPLSEILSYSEHFDLIGSKEEFVSIIRSLDYIENKYHSDKEKAKRKETEEERNVNIKR